jgi:hypothetical protein
MEAVWVLDAGVIAGDEVVLDLDMAETFPGDARIPFECRIECESSWEAARLRMVLMDEAGTLVHDGRLIVDLHAGPNTCTFFLEAAPLSIGRYTARITADYTAEYEPSCYEIHFFKVTDTYLSNMLKELEARFDVLRNRLKETETGLAPVNETAVRMAVAEKFLNRAARKRTESVWRSLYPDLLWLEKTAAGIAAELAFASLVTERLTPARIPRLTGLEIDGGGFQTEAGPVFLFGRNLSEPDRDAIDELNRFGLNLAVVSMGPDTILAGPGAVRAFKPRYQPFFDAAADANVSVAVSLAPQDAGAWAFENYPDLREKGFFDLAHTAAKENLLRAMQALLPWLAGQPALNSLCLAENPAFQYDSDAVRARFIKHIQEIYPDRQTLNQTWLSHLAAFEEIVVRGDFPEHAYQNSRPFQFDWQCFHRELVIEYMSWLTGAAREYAPGVPVQVMLPDTAFVPGETRNGVAREMAGALMDISGCSVTALPSDLHYAMAYPGQAIQYSLMQSAQPGKPVFNLRGKFDLPPVEDGAFLYRYIHASLWNGVVSGMNALALPEDTPLLDMPESLEAFAVTALQINRLAEIVMAFQQAPAEIGIVFSDASKIFDDGVPHLLSAWYAWEGCSFAGYNLRFLTEDQVAAGIPDTIRVLVIPETPALQDDAFHVLSEFVEHGGTVARIGTPIPYNERGISRHDVIRNTAKTVLVRGMNLPTEYLHAMDAAIVQGALPVIPRPINASGYPLEGVRTRYAETGGSHCVFVMNLRKEPVICHLAGHMQTGRDLIAGRPVSFPMELAPLVPMLIRLDSRANELVLAGSGKPAE